MGYEDREGVSGGPAGRAVLGDARDAARAGFRLQLTQDRVSSWSRPDCGVSPVCGRGPVLAPPAGRPPPRRRIFRRPRRLVLATFEVECATEELRNTCKAC